MYITMLDNLATAEQCFQAGQTYEVPDHTGICWELSGLAKPTTIPPPHITNFFDRLDKYENQQVIFLPFVGEFGHQILTHIRIVNWTKCTEKIVCCRDGEQVLYPSGICEIDWVDPVSDNERIATMRDHRYDWLDIRARYPNHVPIHAGGLSPAQELLVIHPNERIPFQPRIRNLKKPDVVIATRKRSLFPERNWKHWDAVGATLRKNGITYAVVGDRRTSFDLDGSIAYTGDLDTDAAIELLQSCRVFVGTDTGASHLASTVGCKMIVFRETRSGSRDLFPRMEIVNPGRINVIKNGWEDPSDVINAIIKTVGNQWN